MTTVKLIDRLAVLIAVVALVIGVAARQPVVGGVLFWAALVGGWLLKRRMAERQDKIS